MKSRSPLSRIAALGLCLGCTSITWVHNRVNAKCGERAFDGAALSCDGAMVAELRCLATRGGVCKSLVIDYPGGARTVLWTAEARFDPQHPEAFQPGDGSFAAFIDDVSVAPDGSRLWFRHRSSIFSSITWHTYDLNQGMLREVDAAAVWEEIHYKYRDRDVPLRNLEDRATAAR
jgi:hypothetical protein